MNMIQLLFFNLLIVLTLNHQPLFNNYTNSLFLNRNEAKYMYSIIQINSDSCDEADEIAKIIVSYIKNNNDSIYSTEFLNLMKDNAFKATKCSFPRNGTEVELYYNLYDSAIFKYSFNDIRAIKLTFDLYLISQNAGEFGEYSKIFIPNLIVNNFQGFIECLKGYKIEDIQKLIDNLDYLNELDRKNVLNKISNTKDKNERAILKMIKKELE